MNRTLQSIRVMALIGVIAGIVHSETTFFGPVPYLSTADRPAEFCTDCVVEDFEQGSVNSFLSISPASGRVLGPEELDDFGNRWVDSVELPGHSWFLEDASPVLTIDFAQPVSSAGLVWTDGDRNVSVVFESFDASGASLGSIGPVSDISDGMFFGSTDEDRFFGVVDPNGISRLQISNIGSGNGLEVDHITWQAVPEPGALPLLLIGLGHMFATCRRRLRS